MEDRLILNLILHRAEFLKIQEKNKILNFVSSVDDLKKISLKDLIDIIGRKFRTKMWDVNFLEKEALEDMEMMNSGQIGFISISSIDYPFLLKNIFDPPFMLFYRGDIGCLKNRNVSVVGTRDATGKAHRATFDISYELGKNGIGVVSGLARGIDATSHKGNLSGGGQTVAVLGSGIDTIYPIQNKKLAGEIIETHGVILSEAPLRSLPEKFRFPQRNRIISGLTELTIISQAPKKSGALITYDFALEQGREVAVLKQGLDKIYGAGTFDVLENGAHLVENIEDIKKILDIDINYVLKEDDINYLETKKIFLEENFKHYGR